MVLATEVAPDGVTVNCVQPGIHATDRIQGLGDLSEIVADIERDAKGVPILMREYVKLGGGFLGFNLDPDPGAGTYGDSFTNDRTDLG